MPKKATTPAEVIAEQILHECRTTVEKLHQRIEQQPYRKETYRREVEAARHVALVTAISKQIARIYAYLDLIGPKDGPIAVAKWLKEVGDERLDQT